MNNLIKNTVSKLSEWVISKKFSSYDHYDFWSSTFGILSKRLYRRNKVLGLPFAGSIYLFDTFFPGSRGFFSTKGISAEAMPYFALGYFRLYEIENQNNYLQKGIEILGWLKENATPTKNGLGWGLHFDWPAETTLLPAGTPCVTITSYSTDVFLKAYQITKKKEFLEIVKATADFVFYDLNQKVKSWETAVSHQSATEWAYASEEGQKAGGRKIAISYTPLDENIVMNANSYGAKILYDVGVITGNGEYIDLGNKIVNYILSQQNEDGSWFYFDKDQQSNTHNFIDSFHTCFVLENLFFIWKWNGVERLKESIIEGYRFFVDSFINADCSVRYYHYYPYPTGIKVDIRSCAEAIYCCALLSEMFPESLDLSVRIAEWTINNMRDKGGYFYFRIYRTHKHKMPYMRWGQAPMFNALTYLYQKLEGNKNG